MVTDYKRLIEIYDFVAEYRKDQGFSPTLAEIAEGLNLGKSTINYHLETMVVRGMVRRDHYVWRGIILLSRNPEKSIHL